MNVSSRRVELVWPTAVTCCSAERLVRLARKLHTDFDISGQPLGIEDVATEVPEVGAQDTDVVATSEESAQDMISGKRPRHAKDEGTDAED